MPKHPPERYSPGELDRTRQNLGDLTPEEAKRMARLFDGEIGVERISPEMEEQYHRLEQLNRRRNDPGIVITAPSRESTRSQQGSLRRGRRANYLDRVRNNFWASSPNFRIIPRRQAVQSLFAFLLPVHETLHPVFIGRSDATFYYSLERLVLAVRSLNAVNQRDEVPTLKDPRALKILSVLREWDIETIHQELSVLQRSPRNQPVGAAAKLCRALYRPFFQLIDLDPAGHLLPAVKRLFDLDMMAYPQNSAEAARIKRMGSTLRQELLHLFNEVRRSCAPLLVKLADLPHAPYPEVFGYFRGRILEFLTLTEAEILTLEGEDLLLPDETRQNLPDREGDEEDEDGVPGEDGETPNIEEDESADDEEPLPENADQALDFLTKLFPQSGFEVLNGNPDLFGYFKSIVSFPKNTDLLHPANPVQQIAVLLALIQEFLYGFRQIIFGELIDEEGAGQEIQGEVDRFVNTWHKLLDELVCGRLLIDLVDYCRQIERASEYRYTEAGIRQENSIMLRIQRTLLPHLNVPAVRGLLIPEERNLPRLPLVAAEFSTLLDRCLARVPEGRTPAIKNPHAPFHFEIESYLTKRFRSFLQRRGLPQDNRHLVYFTSRMLLLLDYLVNDPASHLYRQERFPLYRHEEGHLEIPIYTIPGMKTERIIEGSEMELSPPEEFLEESGAGKDRASGLLQARGYQDAMTEAVENYHAHKIPLTLAVVSIPELRILGPESRQDRLRVVGHCVRGEIREYSDLPYRLEDDTIPIILPETTGENSLRFCRRLIRTVLEKLPETGIHIGITPYHPTWSAAKLRKIAAKCGAEAERRRSPAIIIYREAEDRYEELPLNEE